MAKPAVIVVGADKGGVGKTTVCRTVLDYFSANNVPTRAFDTESPRGTLKRFHPDITEIVDMTATADQMKIFDTLGSAAPSVTVIDVREFAEISASGKARGALHIPLTRLQQMADPRHPDHVDALRPEARIALYCASGARSGSAQRMLQQMGYEDAHNIGGLGHWVRAGGQVERI